MPSVTDTALQNIRATLESRDWFLEHIAELVEAGLGLGMTIVLDGAIISGELIDGKTYFEQLSVQIARALAEDERVAELVSDAWAGAKKTFDKPPSRGESGQPSDFSYLHFQDARIFAPGQPALPNQMGMLLRCRIDAVSAFTLQTFRAQPPSA